MLMSSDPQLLIIIVLLINYNQFTVRAPPVNMCAKMCSKKPLYYL